MNKGIVYFVQPVELKGTNRYKIGCSKNPNLDRVRSYRKGTRYILICECINPLIVEKKLIKLFNENFKCIGGREFFAGDETIMKEKFLFATSCDNDMDGELDSDEEDSHNIIHHSDIDSPKFTNNSYEVVTYDEWKKNNNISNLIITNIKSQEGYLRFNNGLWIKLHNQFTFNNSETLRGFVENCGNNNDIDKILKDSIKKRYSVTYEFYNLNYHEFTVSCSYSPNNTYPIYLFDSLNLLFNKIDDVNLINDKILLEEHCSCSCIYLKDEVDTVIVSDILHSFVKPEILTQYKKLVYNLLVKQEDNQLIFYDFFEGFLTSWLLKLLDTLSGANLYIYSDDYYSANLEKKKLIKLNKPRCVIITELKTKSLKRQIDDFIKLGFKYIIVLNTNIKYKKDQIYNIANYRNFLNNNKEKIINTIKSEIDYLPEPDWKRIIMYDDNIFSKSDLLLTNFLYWCCKK